MADDEVREDGYPDSPPEDLRNITPDVTAESADRVLEEEGMVTPTGEEPDGDPNREDAFFDAHDADELGAAEVQGSGRPVTDEANYGDNAAEWSRSD